MKQTCSACGETTFLANRTRKLCQKCNTARLHPEGKTRTPIKRQSAKEADRKAKLYEVYGQIAAQRPYVCTGCGRREGLTHSHLIPRSRRKDLETEPRNITYHCLACHAKWESNTLDMMLLHDFDKSMAYVKEADEKYYNFIIFKLKWTEK